MSKYEKLSAHLASLNDDEWTAEFKDIEAILGFALPRSARTYPAWWSNQTDEGHSQSASWKSVGWRTQKLDLSNKRLTFVRQQGPDTHQPSIAHDRNWHSGGLTIAEAKAGLSLHFGVPPESVEITIKG